MKTSNQFQRIKTVVLSSGISSVNPVNMLMKQTRKEAQLRYFNDKLQSGLDESFQWIDTYKYLMKNQTSQYSSYLTFAVLERV